MSSKDDCFRDAITKYNDMSEKKIDIELEKEWVKDAGTEQWAPRADEGPIWRLFNSIWKTLRIWNKEQDPRPPGSANPKQLRRPDMTITTKDGRQIVVDNKFTRKNGKSDDWGKGGQSGSNQRDDYNEINEQNGSEGKDLALNKDVCKCDGEPQQVAVWVPVPGLSPNPNLVPFTPLPSPGAVPPVPVVEPVPMPVL